MTMRSMVSIVFAVSVSIAPVARAHAPGTNHSTPGHEAALAVAASLSSLVYFPAKLSIAAVGLVGGGLAGVLTGGETRAAYALWVPLAGGDYVVRPEHIDGVRPFDVFGRHYDDEPSQFSADGSVIYDSLYGPDAPAE